MRIAIVSDTHLSSTAPDELANAEAAACWIDMLQPDRVVHLGDIVADGVRRPEDYALALATFGRAALMNWLPGNHDIGEDPITAAAGGDPVVNSASLADWRVVFGPDRWNFAAPGWTVIGLNAQLCGVDSDLGAAQEDWLDELLQRTSGKVGLMLHKPVFRDNSADQDSHRRYLPVPARRRLWNRFAGHDLRFVISGHTHQWRQHVSAGVEHVWAPSTAYVFAERLQETIGRKVVGAMVLDLLPQGHQFAFVDIDGLRQREFSAHD